MNPILSKHYIQLQRAQWRGTTPLYMSTWSTRAHTEPRNNTYIPVTCRTANRHTQTSCKTDARASWASHICSFHACKTFRCWDESLKFWLARRFNLHGMDYYCVEVALIQNRAKTNDSQTTFLTKRDLNPATSEAIRKSLQTNVKNR